MWQTTCPGCPVSNVRRHNYELIKNRQKKVHSIFVQMHSIVASHARITMSGRYYFCLINSDRDCRKFSRMQALMTLNIRRRIVHYITLYRVQNTHLSFSVLVRLVLQTGFIVTLSQACFTNAELGRKITGTSKLPPSLTCIPAARQKAMVLQYISSAVVRLGWFWLFTCIPMRNWQALHLNVFVFCTTKPRFFFC